MIELKMKSGTDATLQYHHDSGLIMLHSDNISAQWPPNQVGVELVSHGKFVKVGFHNNGCYPSYQSFHFARNEFEKLYDFFKALGYPLHGARESLKIIDEMLESMSND